MMKLNYADWFMLPVMAIFFLLLFIIHMSMIITGDRENFDIVMDRITMPCIDFFYPSKSTFKEHSAYAVCKDAIDNDVKYPTEKPE